MKNLKNLINDADFVRFLTLNYTDWTDPQLVKAVAKIFNISLTVAQVARLRRRLGLQKKHNSIKNVPKIRE